MSNSLEASNNTITKSALLIASLDLFTPIDSTWSVDSLIPAVSNKWSITPFKLISPSTTSLVVPAISVTIALDSPNKAFNKDDLPTLGLPTKATLIPSLIINPFSPDSTKELI